MNNCLPCRVMFALFAVVVFLAGCGSTAIPFLTDTSLPDDVGFPAGDTGGTGGDTGTSDATTGDGGSSDISTGDAGSTDQGSADGGGGADAGTDGGKAGCLENTDCKGSVCDKKNGSCVECVAYTDCLEGSDCRGNHCDLLVNPGVSGGVPSSLATYDLKIPEGLLGTTIPLTIHLPDGPGPFPIIVFTHGFQLSPTDYTSYGQHLASWGFIVIMPAMPGSIISPKTHVKLKEYLVKILDWVASDNAVPTGVLKGKGDLARIGLSGHSMGGKISLLTCTEDARPKASFVIDPVDATGSPLPVNAADYPSVTPELMPKITIPVGYLGETVNGDVHGAYVSGLRTGRQQLPRVLQVCSLEGHPD